MQTETAPTGVYTYIVPAYGGDQPTTASPVPGVIDDSVDVWYQQTGGGNRSVARAPPYTEGPDTSWAAGDKYWSPEHSPGDTLPAPGSQAIVLADGAPEAGTCPPEDTDGSGTAEHSEATPNDVGQPPPELPPEKPSKETYPCRVPSYYTCDNGPDYAPRDSNDAWQSSEGDSWPHALEPGNAVRGTVAPCVEVWVKGADSIECYCCYPVPQPVGNVELRMSIKEATGATPSGGPTAARTVDGGYSEYSVGVPIAVGGDERGADTDAAVSSETVTDGTSQYIVYVEDCAEYTGVYMQTGDGVQKSW